MSNTITARATDKPQLSLRTQTIATIAAIIAAVVVPQIFHVLGAVSGLGNALGETFLPMHLPIILAGLLAGPYAGGIAGLLGPAASFALSGMPGPAMLPFMMLELCIYGVSSGLLRKTKMPVIGKVAISQVAGRAVRALAMVFAFYILGNQAVSIPVIWTSIAAGIFGLVLQWTFLPLLVYRVENRVKHERK